jgi:hypothetical protein
MSEGPIKQWRDSWKLPSVSTNASTAVHAASEQTRHGTVCGKRGTTGFAITCSDCYAAMRADS